ncbi:MAG: GTP-binding protein [Gemmatimonadaceae bacterium]|nr:GTP-binding protein [Acetobacteraceae bacterium]
MASVRSDLGPDALILSTRRVADGVDVTAALDTAPEPVEPRHDAALAWHGVPARVIADLTPGALADTLPRVLPFAALPKGDGAPLLLTGPPGAGKTLTVAKLATRMVLAGQAPLVITADGLRAGAPEQLAAYTRLLGLTLVVASTAAPLRRALARRQGAGPVLIDTAGLDPFDPVDRDGLMSLMEVAGALTALVLPAGLDPAEAEELAGAFGEAGASLLIATRLDLCRRMGGVLAAAATGLSLTEAGTGPAAADGLVPLTPDFLAGRLAIPPGLRQPELQDAA